MSQRPPASRERFKLLHCSDGSLECGITNNLPNRLQAHAAGKASRYTRSPVLVNLVSSEPQKPKAAALEREAAIKKLPRDAKQQLVARRKGHPSR